MDLEIILSQIEIVNQIIRKYEDIHQNTGEKFNIFETLDVADSEVAICRVICDIMNKNGGHSQKNTFFRLFVENVLKLEFSENDYKTVKVFREYTTDYRRRIDLLIKTADKSIPIEVKLYADDQEEQCKDYLEYAKNSNLYYLTLFGKLPDKKSVGGLDPEYDAENQNELIGYKGITLISFQKEIIEWLEICLKLNSTIKIAPVREVLLQFITIIKRLTHTVEKDIEMEIKEVLMDSSKYMKSAVIISNSLIPCKIEMIKKVFQSLEERIEIKFGKHKLMNEYDYSIKADDFYNQVRTTWPGISYFCKSLDKEDLSLWFRIEIHDKLFAGFCTPIKDKHDVRQLNDNEVLKILKVCRITEKKNWWIYWDHIPSESESPNFKYDNIDNDTYYNLFDPKKFEIFIDQCMNSIEKIWSLMK